MEIRKSSEPVSFHFNLLGVKKGILLPSDLQVTNIQHDARHSRSPPEVEDSYGRFVDFRMAKGPIGNSIMTGLSYISCVIFVLVNSC